VIADATAFASAPYYLGASALLTKISTLGEKAI
jgi:hypothetical protein